MRDMTLKKRECLGLMTILALAAALRVAAYIIVPDQSQLLVDSVVYRQSAIELIQHFRIASPYQMPLYPLLIAIVGAGKGQIAADIAISVAMVWVISALAQEIFADRRAAILAAIAAACYPPLIFFSVVGLTETLFTTLVLLAFLNWYRGHFSAAAVFSVLAVLTRPIFDLFAPLLVVIFSLFIHRSTLAVTLRRLAVYAVIYCGLMAPWWISNYQTYGSFVRLTPGAGVALYAGNNPLNRTGGGNVNEDYDLRPFNTITDPVKLDKALTDAALTYIIEHPRRFIELAGMKFVRMWRLWPVHNGYTSPSVILLAVLSFVPVLLLAGIGLFFKRAMLKRLAPLLFFGAGYTAIHMIILGTIRYRFPLEPFLLIFAGVAVSQISNIVWPVSREPVRQSQ